MKIRVIKTIEASNLIMGCSKIINGEEKAEKEIIDFVKEFLNIDPDDPDIKVEIVKEIPKSVSCKRCGEKPETRIHCTLYEVRCVNRKCPKPTTVGSHTRLECAVDSWNRKQCPHENKLPNQDLGHTICQDCGQIL